MKSKTFCVIPWIHLSITTSGLFRPCCNVSYMEEDYINGGRFKRHSIADEKIEDVWNSDTYVNFRKKMLNGERLAPCSRCYREEEAGVKSSRINFNDTYMPIADIKPDGTCSLNSIKYIDVRLGNVCNLSCRMCNPYASSKWIDEEKVTELRDVSHEDLDRLKRMDWFDTELFWNNINSILDSCEILYFSGGEPTMFTKHQYKIFDECIKRDIAKNITLRYNTNLTILPPTLIEYWKHFKLVRVNCSIDGVGKVNDYIRYPSKWDVVSRNFKTLQEMKKDYPIGLKVHTTVQMYNIYNLIELFEYFKCVDIFPYLNILNHPPHYNIKVLNKKQKDLISKTLHDWYKKNASDKSKKLLQVIDYMNQEDWNHLYEDFIHETRVLDNNRNQTIESYVPEVLV